MTSMAFVLGVLPLALARGAGAGSQNAIGWAVAGGMTSATVLAILIIPVFFVLVRRVARGKPSLPEPPHGAAIAGADGKAGHA
jgi:Cu/Ag efflux pump CusA